MTRSLSELLDSDIGFEFFLDRLRFWSKKVFSISIQGIDTSRFSIETVVTAYTIHTWANRWKMSVHTTSRNLTVCNELTVILVKRMFSSNTVGMSTSVTYYMTVHQINFLSLREIATRVATFQEMVRHWMNRILRCRHDVIFPSNIHKVSFHAIIFSSSGSRGHRRLSSTFRCW